MATGAGECGAPASCYAVRLASPAGSRLVMRIAAAILDRCSALVPRLGPRADDELCLRADDLCASEQGAGVVCAGKLCGVVGEEAAGRAGCGVVGGEAVGCGAVRGEAAGCGAVRAVAVLSRRRRFLHCAHTLRACARDKECSALCSETLLFEEPTDVTTDTLTLENITSFRTATEELTTARGARPSPTPTPPRGPAPPTRTASPMAPTPGAEIISRVSFEFEPNRADFKAGEYGDNAAEYGGDEPAPPSPPGTPSATPARASPRAPPAPPATPAPPPLEAQMSADGGSAPPLKRPGVALGVLPLVCLGF
ncbi:SH3 domain-binding protein 1-like [Bombyx mandarina]|uniref:SH3 domain-binding protein 1-like n=1 Tax=Bombyx mandarina TaxID=7092 RepID=A0A6J2KQ25_BOMMA|nr:SH3 domain-binding protein 1-like [Bombyx mandarina]